MTIGPCHMICHATSCRLHAGSIGYIDIPLVMCLSFLFLPTLLYDITMWLQRIPSSTSDMGCVERLYDITMWFAMNHTWDRAGSLSIQPMRGCLCVCVRAGGRASERQSGKTAERPPAAAAAGMGKPLTASGSGPARLPAAARGWLRSRPSFASWRSPGSMKARRQPGGCACSPGWEPPPRAPRPGRVQTSAPCSPARGSSPELPSRAKRGKPTEHCWVAPGRSGGGQTEG